MRVQNRSDGHNYCNNLILNDNEFQALLGKYQAKDPKDLKGKPVIAVYKPGGFPSIPGRTLQGIMPLDLEGIALIALKL